MPVIGTAVPIAGFYWAAPVLLLGVFFYLHIGLQHLWGLVSKLPAVFPDGVPLDEKAYPWLLTGLARIHVSRLRLRSDLPALARLRARLAVILAWWVVPITMLLFWVRYLTRHHWPGTNLHIALVVVAVSSGMLLQTMARRTLRGEGWQRVPLRPTWSGTRRAAGVLVTAAIMSSVSNGAINGDPSAPVPLAFSALGYNVFADLRETTAVSIADLRNYLRYADLTAADLTDADLTAADLTGATLTGADLRNATLIDATLTGADLRNATLIDATLTGATLTRADLTDAVLTDADLTRAVLIGAVLADADLIDAPLIDATLTRADLTGADLTGAVLTDADLTRAILRDAALPDAALPDAALSYATLIYTDLTEAVLIGADLTHADLRGADLSSALLINAVLGDADLRGADLSSAFLIGATLTRADLTGAVLTDATLTRAILIGAVLADADFRNATLIGATLTQAQLDLACGDAETTLSGGLTIPPCPEDSAPPQP